MRKWITVNLVAVVSLIGTVIIGLVSVSWKAEKKTIYKDIEIVKTASRVQDSITLVLIASETKAREKELRIYKESHSEIHEQTSVQYTQIQADLTIIKTHLINN